MFFKTIPKISLNKYQNTNIGVGASRDPLGAIFIFVYKLVGFIRALSVHCSVPFWFWLLFVFGLWCFGASLSAPDGPATQQAPMYRTSPQEKILSMELMIQIKMILYTSTSRWNFVFQALWPLKPSALHRCMMHVLMMQTSMMHVFMIDVY